MSFAFIFETVGGTEWLVLLGVVLIVVGPKNLPSAARKMGQIMSTLRRAADEFKRQLLTMDQEVRKTVEDAVKTDYVETPKAESSSTPSTSAGVTEDRAETENENDPYADDNPYPGYDGYRDTDYEYDDDAGPEMGNGDAVGSTAAASDAAPEPAAKAGPTEDELKAITITVSPVPEGKA